MNLLLFIIGLTIGSFLNVIIYRLPENKSIMLPASHCPECGTRLKPFDLVPVLSFLIYRGKCRYCSSKISWQYPVVELLTGLLFLLIYLKFGLSIKTAIYLILISLLIVCSIIDLKYKIIPNKITYSGIILGLILSLFFDHLTFISSLIGGLIPAGLLFLIALVYKKGMGIGDVKLVAMIGVFTGYKIVLAGIFIGSIVGLLFVLPLLIAGKMSRKSRIPFGPFISIGSLIMLYIGNTLIDCYFNLFI